MYLNCHTGFSFKYGTLPIKTLFEEAKRCGIHKPALTEINNTASYLEMLRICDVNRPLENGLTKFGKEAYRLDIAVGIIQTMTIFETQPKLRGLLKIQFPLIISPRASRGETGLPSQRHGIR